MSDPSDAVDARATRDMAASVAAMALVIGAASFSIFAGAAPDGAPERCALLLDRFVELRLLAANPRTSPGVIEQQQAGAREEAERSRALERCQRHLTKDSAACADRAQSADELERCFF